MSHFRPRSDPAQAIYDALVAEMEFRQHNDDWEEAERNAVHHAAMIYANKNGLRIPTREEIERAERQAMGHFDYAAKFAYGVADTFKGQIPSR